MLKFQDRIVTSMPLKELWNDTGLIEAEKLHALNKKEIVNLLGSSELVIANISSKLIWIDKSKNYEVWKKDLQENICNESEGCSLEDFKGNYFYFASLWLGSSRQIILLEKYH